MMTLELDAGLGFDPSFSPIFYNPCQYYFSFSSSLARGGGDPEFQIRILPHVLWGVPSARL
jgi:hypothetical protein